MRPVMQTTYGDPGGNCFEACIASITGIELERIPHFLGEGWFEDYVAWLRHAGWNAVWWDAGAGGIPPGFAIASGQPEPHNRKPVRVPMKVVRQRRRRRLLRDSLRSLAKGWGK